MTMILILNGPNLNLLGERQPEVYGRETLADVERACGTLAAELGVSVECRQSNHEGALVDWIQEARGRCAGIILNAGAYTHSSIALLDALNAFEGRVIELHVSNVHAREPFRHHSFIAARADGVIAGFGTMGYPLALRRMAAWVA